MSTHTILSNIKIRLTIWLTFFIAPLNGMAIDLVAPSLPAIAADLQVSAIYAKNTISIYLAGFVIVNLFLGFLSDALGRKKILVVSFLSFTLASLLPIIWPSAHVLLLARFLQGLALGTFSILGRTLLSDILPNDKLLRVIPMLAAMWGIGPIIGPIIGGYLQFYFNWQAGFYFFAIYGGIIFMLVTFVLPETHLNKQRLNFTNIKTNIATVISHRLFIGVAILMGCTYSLLVVFNTVGPFLIQVALHHTSVYFGHIALYAGASFLVGSLLCRYLIGKYSPEFVFSKTITLCSVIAPVILLLAYIYPHSISIILLANTCLFLACGVIYPAAMGKGIASFRHIAGTASAVLNLINTATTSLTAALMSIITVDSATILMLIYCCYLVIIVVCYQTTLRSKNAH